ncbi:DNA_BRE_C domain containing protein [Comamonadaceae bacterium]
MDQKAAHQTVTQTLGKTTFSWNESTPLLFVALSQESVGEPQYRQEFDLAELTIAFEESFLLALKDLIMQRFLKVRVKTMKSEYGAVLLLLRKIQSDQASTVFSKRLMETNRISSIDSGLMLAIRQKLAEATNWINVACIDRLSEWFHFVGNGVVFKDLERGDFPTTNRFGHADLRRQGIISKALSRTLQIAVLTDVEHKFQAGKLHLGVYVLWNLTNTIYARPESLRQIRCCDLNHTKNEATGDIDYTLWVMPAKRGGQRMSYPLTQTLGNILVKQQAWVVEHVGPLYGLKDELDPEKRKAIEQRLALFPRITTGKRTDFEAKHFGMLEDGTSFSENYIRPIQRSLDNITVNFNVMRHTIGTQLAAAGVSAAIIQAVLRHASDVTARVYIDLAAKELRESLNSGLEALEELFPAYSAFRNADETRAMALQFPERIVSSRGPVDPHTGQIDVETIGGCGKSAACAFAPLSCYGCWRWIANVDADHSVNLRLVQDRIRDNEAFGKSMKAIVDRDRLLEKLIELRMGQFERHKAENTQKQDVPKVGDQ